MRDKKPSDISFFKAFLLCAISTALSFLIFWSIGLMEKDEKNKCKNDTTKSVTKNNERPVYKPYKPN
jgi:hypothetical protein